MKIEGNSMIKLLPRQLIAWGTACATILGMASLPAAASAAATTITATNAVNVSDGNATSQTRALFKKLADTTAGGLRFGQQHATDEAISPTAANGDVYEMTGKYPAVMGWDAGLGLTGEEKPGASGASQDANAQALAKDIAAANKEGAIVTLSAHWHNPATNGAYNDTTKVADEILPGGSTQRRSPHTSTASPRSRRAQRTPRATSSPSSSVPCTRTTATGSGGARRTRPQPNT